MRNGKHYVSVRLTKTEKEYFLSTCKSCGVPEKTLLYWLVNNMPVREKPPEAYFKLNRLFTHMEINVDHIRLNGGVVSKSIRNKYHELSNIISKYDNKIFRKIMFF